MVEIVGCRQFRQPHFVTHPRVIIPPSNASTDTCPFPTRTTLPYHGLVLVDVPEVLKWLQSPPPPQMGRNERKWERNQNPARPPVPRPNVLKCPQMSGDSKNPYGTSTSRYAPMKTGLMCPPLPTPSGSQPGRHGLELFRIHAARPFYDFKCSSNQPNTSCQAAVAASWW